MKVFCVHELKELIFFKSSYYPKCTINGTIPKTFFAEMYLKKLKLIWNDKRPQIGRTILSEKNKDGRFTLPYFKIYHKGTIIKRVWHWNKNKHVDQLNWIDNYRINPHNWPLTKVSRIHNEERIVSSILGKRVQPPK